MEREGVDSFGWGTLFEGAYWVSELIPMWVWVMFFLSILFWTLSHGEWPKGHARVGVGAGQV